MFVTFWYCLFLFGTVCLPDLKGGGQICIVGHRGGSWGIPGWVVGGGTWGNNLGHFRPVRVNITNGHGHRVDANQLSPSHSTDLTSLSMT